MKPRAVLITACAGPGVRRGARVPGTRLLPAGAEAGLRAAFQGVRPARRRGPLTLQALQAWYIGVALLFTTDPGIPARHLVVLADDRGLQPAENITALVPRSTMERHGPRLLAVLTKVSALLDTGTLRALDARVELAGQTPGWSRAAGCAHTGWSRQGVTCIE